MTTPLKLDRRWLRGPACEKQVWHSLLLSVSPSLSPFFSPWFVPYSKLTQLWTICTALVSVLSRGFFSYLCQTAVCISGAALPPSHAFLTSLKVEVCSIAKLPSVFKTARHHLQEQMFKLYATLHLVYHSTGLTSATQPRYWSWSSSRCYCRWSIVWE